MRKVKTFKVFHRTARKMVWPVSIKSFFSTWNFEKTEKFIDSKADSALTKACLLQNWSKQDGFVLFDKLYSLKDFPIASCLFIVKLSRYFCICERDTIGSKWVLDFYRLELQRNLPVRIWTKSMSFPSLPNSDFAMRKILSKSLFGSNKREREREGWRILLKGKKNCPDSLSLFFSVLLVLFGEALKL